MDRWEKIHAVCGVLILIAAVVFAAVDQDGMASDLQIWFIMGVFVSWLIWGCRLCARHMPEHGSGWWGS